MSYSIEYNRQFIKTENGYTPCWLVGDNNVTEGFGRNERRVRNWSVFMNLLDVTEDELVEKAKELFNSYDQHWKRGSTWVSNKGLISWVKSGCKKAATVEDILSVNPYMSRIHCYLVYYDEKDCRQVILEFMELDKKVICMDKEGNTKTYTVQELCPYPFSSEDLK